MGRESRVNKDRVCKHCGTTFRFTSAEQLHAHADYCLRMQVIGLTMPTRPELIITRVEE